MNFENVEHQEINIKAQNLKYHCCTCLHKPNDLKHGVNDLKPSLLEIFQQCTGYSNFDLNPHFPNIQICGQCFQKLEMIDEFQRTSKKSMLFYQELIKSFQPESNTTFAKYEKQSACEENEIVDILVQPERPDLFDGTDEVGDPLLFQVSIKPEITDESYELSDVKDDVDEVGVSDQTAPTFPEEIKTLAHKNSAQEVKRRFRCKLCEVDFSKRHQLKYHMRKKHKNDSIPKIKCKFGCEKSFYKEQTAENHYKKMHCNEDKEEDIPKKGKISKEALSLKTKIKEKLEELRCSLVNGTKGESEGENKNEESLVEGISKTTCLICVKDFPTVSGLNVHMRIHLDERPFQCDKCDRGFNKRALLTNHLKEIHGDTPVEIVCEYGCGRVFNRQDTARNHYRLKHILPAKGIERDYKKVCEDCGRVCKNLSVLKEHRNIHLPPELRPFPCEQCGKRFSMKKSLTIHLARHAGTKNYECKICGLKKVTGKELRVHMNTHTQERQYHCPICAKAFNSCSNMKRHEQVVHQGLKKYNCRFCSESFGKPDTLKHHEMRHTGERPHKCNLCSRAFIQVVALRAHMKTHYKLGKMLTSEETSENMLNVSPLFDK